MSRNETEFWSMCCHVYSMKCGLQLIFITLGLILKADSWHDDSKSVHGLTGENVTLHFKFQDHGIKILSSNLRKNDNKIGICKQASRNCSERFVLSDVDDNSTATLYIINITSDDEGRYQVSLFADAANPLIHSNRIFLTVEQRNTTTENRSTSLNKISETPKLETSKTQVIFIYINASLILLICFCMGLLFWFLRSYARKQATKNHGAQSNDTTQGGRGKLDAVNISSVEYGELDFQNRPARDDRVRPDAVTSKEEDGVEYAAIIFPQQKQTPGGRMRDKQRTRAITR